MDFLRESEKLDEVVPGVIAAYSGLRSSDHQGIFTSLGRFYNHTLFGRDAGMSAKFVSDFDHQTVWDTITTLAAHQGCKTDTTTQEQPGRIHHELRDFTAWKGHWYDRFGLWVASRVWGVQNRQLLSYFAADTTATYIRLVHKYATHIDSSVLARQVPQRDGSTISLAESVQAAANWIVAQVNSDGLFQTTRTNRFSLPYQTFCDSVTAYAWADGTPADTSKPHSFLEAHVYALDAMHDAIALVPTSVDLHYWRHAASRLEQTLLARFWDGETGSFTPGLFMRDEQLAALDSEMITAGWTLNASFWQHLAEDEREHYVTEIVSRLFHADFLSQVGLRTRSLGANEPLGDTIDYHGSQTVWPMFNFMVIEGLRRHGLYRLARQLEFRLLNGINAVGAFNEFLIVDRDGLLYRPDKHAARSIRGQMIPEQNIAFTVVPALTLAYRHLYRRHDVATAGWKYELESRILDSIDDVQLLSPTAAREQLAPEAIKLKRTAAGLASAWHIAPVLVRKP
ncbi:MAG TPA: hypothetical protein VL362_01950 [Patescibacteria group bacterium]|jgi:glycogen debranching enzyme|nr:hypothetical protein [Patescibacteria group bacterium]